jgi:POT family proton-dependent oligopeptide transporter
MAIGLAHYVAQSKLLGDAGLLPKKEKGAPGIPTEPLNHEEVRKIGAIAMLFFFNVLFWTIYEQGGSSLNVFADKCTRTEILGWAFPSSWMQSLQAVFVIILAPAFSWLWIRLGDRQPSSPAKFTFGLLLLGMGIFLMVPAATLAEKGLVSPLWLCAVYFLQVMGELCLSPVGLSTVTKLAPQRFLGLAMGLWFLGTALGNFMAGWLGGFFDENNTEKLIVLFGSMGAAAVVATVLLAVLTPRIRSLMGNVK